MRRVRTASGPRAHSGSTGRRNRRRGGSRGRSWSRDRCWFRSRSGNRSRSGSRSRNRSGLRGRCRGGRSRRRGGRRYGFGGLLGGVLKFFLFGGFGLRGIRFGLGVLGGVGRSLRGGHRFGGRFVRFLVVAGDEHQRQGDYGDPQLLFHGVVGWCALRNRRRPRILQAPGLSSLRPGGLRVFCAVIPEWLGISAIFGDFQPFALPNA